jgi:hypothetical protein
MNSIESVLRNDWDIFGATLSSFDDGHVPENLQETAANVTQLVDFEMFKRSPLVHVYENSMEDPGLLDEIYDKTVNSNPQSTGNKAWGDYVTIEQIKDYWQNDNDSASLVLKLTARYLQLALGEGSQPSQQYPCNDNKGETLFTRKDLENAHGVAIWSLAAQSGVSIDRCPSFIPF